MPENCLVRNRHRTVKRPYFCSQRYVLTQRRATSFGSFLSRRVFLRCPSRHFCQRVGWNYLTLSKEQEASDNRVCFEQGDNDPVDVVEIGSETLVAGGVYAVKPLAVLAMIDDGELDWKVAAIRVDDPKANLVNDVEDVERCCPLSCLLFICLQEAFGVCSLSQPVSPFLK